MEKIITQSGIGIDKNDSPGYRASEEAIINKSKNRNLVQKFKEFCVRQNENRLGWTAVIIAAQVFLLVPITLIAIAWNGDRFVLWIPVIVSSFVTAVSNLAAMPTTITIPIFCTSVLINVGVIMLSFMQ